MAFIEDLSQFFSEDDFAVEAVITLSDNTQKTVKVIFNMPTLDVPLYDAQIAADSPNFLAATSDLAGVRKPNPVSIGGKNFKVEKVAHDGTGMSTVYLLK